MKCSSYLLHSFQTIIKKKEKIKPHNISQYFYFRKQYVILQTTICFFIRIIHLSVAMLNNFKNKNTI